MSERTLSTHPEFLKQPTDEILESLWLRREEAATGVAPEGEPTLDRRAVDRMVSDGYALWSGDRPVLTEAGEERARAVVRSHRLAERLLADVLGVPAGEAEKTACLMEHILSPAVTDAVCGFLGHPPTCPHGREIPSGACCGERKNGIKPLVVPLNELEPGRSARVMFIAPGVMKRLERLASFGLVPGTVVELRQKRPSFVIEIGGTTLALEGEVAGGIFVRRES
jgi:DtxR family Mn-dependent transcriptional regulator